MMLKNPKQNVLTLSRTESEVKECCISFPEAWSCIGGTNSIFFFQKRALLKHENTFFFVKAARHTEKLKSL